MLDFIDKMIDIVFLFGIPVLVAIIGLVSFFAFFGYIQAGDPQTGFYAGTVFICTFAFFFNWWPEILSYEQVADTKMADMMISTVVAFIIMLICIRFSSLLIRRLKMPAVLVFLLYLGFLIFGF